MDSTVRDLENRLTKDPFDTDSKLRLQALYIQLGRTTILSKRYMRKRRLHLDKLRMFRAYKTYGVDYDGVYSNWPRKPNSLDWEIIRKWNVVALTDWGKYLNNNGLPYNYANEWGHANSRQWVMTWPGPEKL